MVLRHQLKQGTMGQRATDDDDELKLAQRGTLNLFDRPLVKTSQPDGGAIDANELHGTCLISTTAILQGTSSACLLANEQAAQS
jgi:hypothetical protein